MTETKAMEVRKEEMLPEESERTRETRCFIPRADVFETDEDIVVLMDIPGAEQDQINVSLEKNILTVSAFCNPAGPEGYSLAFAEYEVGDYERSFRLSDQIDRDKIQAEYKNGVLRLTLPKAAEAKKRKIEVKVS
ncbi:MAG: Hsp20/alpha crystallin family protein [Anaerolineae bacterium]|nr:MAG: Hsp20/alpha crystallin family protein [Anaerolineae bacterium]